MIMMRVFIRAMQRGLGGTIGVALGIGSIAYLAGRLGETHIRRMLADFEIGAHEAFNQWTSKQAETEQ